MLGKTKGRRKRGHQRIDGWMDMNLGKLQEVVRDRKAWHAAVCGVAKVDMTGRLNSNNIVGFIAAKSFQS